MRTASLAWLSLIVWFVGSLGADPPMRDSVAGRPAQDLKDLIRQLGDDRFERREVAMRQLMERNDAAPLLRQVLASEDKEVARRAADILKALAGRDDMQALARLEALARKGEVDQAVQLLVWRLYWVKEDAAWRTMTELAARLIEAGEKEFGAPPVPPAHRCLPAGDSRRFAEWTDWTKPTFVVTRRVVPRRDGREATFAVRAPEIEAFGTHAGDFLVAGGRLRAGRDRAFDPAGFAYCVILAGGPIEVEEPLVGSVVVCDGHFTASETAKHCLVVARGDVDFSRCRSVHYCRVVASGRVQFGKDTRVLDTKVREGEMNPLGFVKFFDPARAGIEVAEQGGVVVTRLKDDGPFARAGVKAGDEIVALGGVEVKSTEVFRRLLRTEVALHEEAVFTLRRSGKLTEVRVNCGS